MNPLRVPFCDYPVLARSLSACLLWACLSSFAWGHTTLEDSTPGADERVRESPEQLTLRFAEAVNLVKVGMMDQQDHAVGIDFQPAKDAAKTFTVPLPPLAAGRYTVQWTALGGDGHVLEDSFQFTIESDAR